MKKEVIEELYKMDIEMLCFAWWLLEDQPEYVGYIKKLIRAKMRAENFFHYAERFAPSR